ncbi:glycosyltransferase [Henriciella sp. AS95]|uniref:glycosyltransferase n=1 Tax=Henriciella sp. AS95 TaxID=3135782 RepID=UPI00317922EA
MSLDAELPEKRLIACVQEHFDADYYLKANNDVSEAGSEPLGHYLLFGFSEGRAPSPRMTGAEMQSIVVELVGSIPDRTQLHQAYQLHRQSSSLFRRLKSAVRKTITPNAAANKANRLGGVFNRGKAPVLTLEDMVNLAAFNALNRSGCSLDKASEVVEHVIEKGYQSLDPLDFHLVPDPPFHRSLYPDTQKLDDANLYLRWLENGYAAGRFLSEAHMLKTVGVTATRLLRDFPHEAYRNTYPDLPLSWSSSQLMLHFLKSGIPEGRFGFDMPQGTISAVVDAIVHINRTNPQLALDLSEKMLVLGHESSRLRLIAVSHYKNLNRIWGASRLLEGVKSGVPIERFWLAYHRGDLQRRTGNLGQALTYLDEAAAIEKDSVWVESEVESLQRAIFTQERQSAEQWAKGGRMNEALSKLDAAIQDTYLSLKPFGWSELPKKPRRFQPPLQRRAMRIGFLADLFLPQCRLYRVDQKIEQLKEAGIDVEMFDFRTESREAFEQVGLFDAWLFYRVPAHFDVLKVVWLANKMGRPTIYEIDDFLIDPEHFPEPYESYDRSLSKEEYAGLQLTTSYNGGVARLCEYGLASTPPLAQELARYVRSSHVITHRNALSSKHHDAIKAAEHRSARGRGNRDRIRIFYGSGTKAHKDFLQEVFFDAIASVLEQRPNVELHTLGHVDAPQLTQRFPDRVVQAEPIWDVSAYWKTLSEADINVAVLKKSLLTDCKSEIKWLEAAMLGIPSVVSGTATMAEIITDGENGMIANTRDEWVARLLTLVDDAALRQSIGNMAREQALETYSVPQMAGQLKSNLEALFAEKKPTRQRKAVVA